MLHFPLLGQFAAVSFGVTAHGLRGGKRGIPLRVVAAHRQVLRPIQLTGLDETLVSSPPSTALYVARLQSDALQEAGGDASTPSSQLRRGRRRRPCTL